MDGFQQDRDGHNSKLYDPPVELRLANPFIYTKVAIFLRATGRTYFLLFGRWVWSQRSILTCQEYIIYLM